MSPATFRLKDYNTFKINAHCDQFLIINSIEDFDHISDHDLQHGFILGGGSNVLIMDDISQPILKMNIKGLDILHEDEQSVHIRVGGGENWTEFVDYTTERNWYGIENLALIPGTVGAGPIQNIGAYGREVKDVIHAVEFYHKSSREVSRLSNAECAFGYRDSIFKNALKNQVIITSVEYILSKTPTHHLDYGPLKEWAKSATLINAQTIAEEVKAIRRSKLPDPEHIGNGGSFFKNPFVSQELFEKLQSDYPTIPHFIQDHNIKIPAGWLIEKAGWKGYREKDYGVHELQALVLVNYGDASGKDIFLLSERIIQDVYEKFQVKLEREINVVPEIKVQ